MDFDPRRTTLQYGRGLRTLSISTVVAIAARSALVFFYAPLEAEQGFLQKIFYVHVPLAIVALCGFVLGGCSRSSICARATRAGTCAPTSSIHMSLIFAVGTLITGSIWAKGSWGHWWVWSEPTLVSFLIIFLLYATYQPLRFAIEDPERQARYASVFAITAGAFVPLNYIAVRLSTAYLHPRVFASTSNLPGSMALTFLVSLIAMALLFATLCKYELTAKHTRSQIRALRRLPGRREHDAPARARSAVPAVQHAPRAARPGRSCPRDGGKGGAVSALGLVGRAAGAAAAHGRQVRRRRLHRAVRDRADLRRDHGDPPEPHGARPRRAAGLAERSDERRRAAAREHGGHAPAAGVHAGMSELLALGISHKTAPVALRERLAFSEREAGEFARVATRHRGVREAVVISTCNRTEIYLVVGEAGARPRPTSSGCSRAAREIRPTELAEAIYSPRNCDAARQLYRVTAGLESMILGEAEIQGQVRRAHETAMRAAPPGRSPTGCSRPRSTTGKRVRSETGIGSSRVERRRRSPSISRSSVLGGLENRHVVILGAGETSELTARALAEQGAGTIFVANRHADRALSLAQRFGGSVVGLDELPEQLVHADIVLSSTSSPHPIVGRDELELVMGAAGRRGRCC